MFVNPTLLWESDLHQIRALLTLAYLNSRELAAVRCTCRRLTRASVSYYSQRAEEALEYEVLYAPQLEDEASDDS